ncbi:hypothetical protein [Flavobacterium tegetincola]|uniref:hypothetical protein n=1 Tax=Flavobacterium tegetincola TaxID=150172 RepID=UPI00047EFA72|nr:hypothetical protein [Flavobacterium tegetincola]
MKKKFAIINLSLMCSVLFAILFQSLHSYEHFLTDDLAVHQHDHQKHDLHENNHNHQKCFVCEFTFNNFVGAEITSYAFKSSFESIVYNSFYAENPSFFSGSHSSLRGPPQVA